MKTLGAFGVTLLLSLALACSVNEEPDPSFKNALPKKDPVSRTASKAETEADLRQRAKRIHTAAVTMDSHVDITGEDYATEKVDPGIDNPELRCDLVKMKRGGMDGVFLAVYVGQRGELNEKGYKKVHETALKRFQAIHRIFNMYPKRCELAVNADDVERISKTGKRAIAIGIENGYPVGEEIANLKKFYDLGARYITLSHSHHNQICDSSGPEEPLHGGLSEFGTKVVAEMNRLGMMCDASHISEKSFYDLIEVSKAPIIASHSGCYAINPHNRNLTDDQLRALKKNGGVIQIVALDSFLKKEPQAFLDALAAARDELDIPTWQEFYKLSEKKRKALRGNMERYWKRRDAIEKEFAYVNVEDLVNHIDHAVKVAGIDHVGIGTDFDGGGGIPGFNNHGEALNVTVALVRRGYSEEEIKKIWGGNLLRVWRDVEKVARNLNP
ncbi:MAG: dipeptidase [Myxococcota bacterium]|nr:dipeptidase [Myxococcota bacterium]